MDITIIYFSGTGNTELIAKKLHNIFQLDNHTVDIVSIEDTEKLHKLQLTNQLVGFGYPVYKFSYPDIWNAIRPIIHKKVQNCKYFQFTTYARFPADATNDFSRMMRLDTFEWIAERNFKAPSCGISGIKDETHDDYTSVMFFEDNIEDKIEEFARDIMIALHKNKPITPSRPSLFQPLRNKIVAHIEITKYPKLQIDVDRCTACGLCASRCPDKNLTREHDKIVIKDDVHCLHCLRCMNHCPKNAIAFGALSRGDHQYTFPIRDRLYKESTIGCHNPYWHNFDKIIRKWKKATILYWLTHKSNPEI